MRSTTRTPKRDPYHTPFPNASTKFQTTGVNGYDKNED